MFSFICINGSVNSREAGDLRRRRAHYDITVMSDIYSYQFQAPSWLAYSGEDISDIEHTLTHWGRMSLYASVN